jgi:hypothetical protein
MRNRIASAGLRTASDLSRIAAEVQAYGAEWGLPQSVIADFTRKCAALSSAVNDNVKGRFDASTIGTPKAPSMLERTPEDSVIDTFGQDEFENVQDFYESSPRTASARAKNLAAAYARSLR